MRDHGKTLAEDLAMRRKKTDSVRLFMTQHTIIVYTIGNGFLGVYTELKKSYIVVAKLLDVFR